MVKIWHHYKYKNLFLLFVGIFLALLLSLNQDFHSFLLRLGGLGYIGAFLAGILFVSMFTVATGGLILFILAQSLHPLEIAILAGIGGVVGDFIIFRFIKDDLIAEITPIYEGIGGNHLTKILHTKYFSWTLPVIGAILIASPLPDEVGVSLMGIAKMKTYQFLIIAFVLDAIGVFLVVSASLLLNP